MADFDALSVDCWACVGEAWLGSPTTHEKSRPAAAWVTWAGGPIREMVPEELLLGFLIAQELPFGLVLNEGKKSERKILLCLPGYAENKVSVVLSSLRPQCEASATRHGGTMGVHPCAVAGQAVSKALSGMSDGAPWLY